MSMVSAVATPVRCSGIPSGMSANHIDVDDAYIVFKEYSCIKGHNFEVAFESPINLPVFWECDQHEVISYES